MAPKKTEEEQSADRFGDWSLEGVVPLERDEMLADEPESPVDGQ